jgi:hypothetical protein
MSRKLGYVVVAIEIASVAALLFLLRQPAMPPPLGLVLVFCLPITFGLHVIEEFIFPDGGPAWFRLARPQYVEAFTETYFFRINAVPLVLSFLVALGTLDFAGGFTFFGIRAWLAFLFFQVIHVFYFHIFGIIRIGRYSPGMITNVFLYVPLTAVSLIHFIRVGAVDPASAIACMGVGFGILWVLDHIKVTGALARGSGTRPGTT